MNVYLDASFLVSLYSADCNMNAAARTMRSSDGVLFVSSLAELEVVNAFELGVFRKETTALQAGDSLKNFAADLCSGIFQSWAVPEIAFARAYQICRQTSATLGTRTADLLHVAVALELNCGLLYSFDERQSKLAQAMKLKLNSVP